MVTASPENLAIQAQALFQESTPTAEFEFIERLSPVHQRLFSVELWEALSRFQITASERDLGDLVELIEEWEATADLDQSPDIVEYIRKPKTYRTLDLS